MEISIVSPPHQGGVMDFTKKIVGTLAPLGSHSIWTQDSIEKIESAIQSCDCIYLQYSGYGYANRGAPLWLLRQLQKSRPRIKTLGIFFHELYAFAPPWSSAFWLSPAQRHIARRLAELSDFWITNREGSSEWLRRFAGDKPHAVLPVFSNVGEMSAYSSERIPKVVVFGGAPLRQATYIAAGDTLFAWAKRQNLEIHDIGPALNDQVLTQRLKSEDIIAHGRLSEMEISKVLADAMFGIVTYPINYIAKSGVFASYCAHGICPVLISENYSTTDGLQQNREYLAGIPTNVCSTALTEEIGKAAWCWYQPHRLNRHIEKLKNMLSEFGNDS